MKKLIASLICLSIISQRIYAQTDAPKTPSEKSEETPQYDDPAKAMQQMQSQMMQQLQKIFGGKDNFQMGDSTQNFGFQQFKLPFGEQDSTMGKPFGFSFDGNGWQLLTPDGDSSNTNGMRQMQEKMQQMMPNFEQFFQGQMPFGADPLVIPQTPLDRQKPKSNKKYQTERL